MLRSLHIENMAIVAMLDVDLEAGFSAITGESGAGKSVLVDCLDFLLGAKPRRELLRRGAEKGSVTALFTELGNEAVRYLTELGVADTEELLLERSLDAQGKSVARLNGRAITQAILKELSPHLVSIHGQNDNQRLMSEAAQKRMLDGACDFGDAMAQYQAAYHARAKAKAALLEVEKNDAEQSRLRDMLSFQIAEIESAALKAGEEEMLLSQRTKLQHAERISKQSAFVYHVLYGNEKASATLILERAAQALAQISAPIPEAEALSKKLMEMRYEVEDVANTARDFGEDIDGDPTKALDRVEARLDAISRLCRKYGADIPAVLAFQKEAKGRLSLLEHADETAERLRREIGELEKRMRSLADQLHRARRREAQSLEARILDELTFLDMPNVRFEIQVIAKDVFLTDGTDEVIFYLSANKGEAPLPLSRVASGGELSRVMLALKSVLRDAEGVDTVVFDEVDTGISGKTARKIGMRLADMGAHVQVISITHSAQVASLAKAHYKIAKSEQEGRTTSTLLVLDKEARVAELARILGGISVTETQRRAALEMLTEGEGAYEK